MKKFILIFSSLLLISTINGQNYQKNLNEEPVIIQNYLGNGDLTNTSSTPAQQNEEMIARVTELSKQLKQARQNGDIQLVKELEKQINAIVGSKEASSEFSGEIILARDGMIIEF